MVLKLITTIVVFCFSLQIHAQITVFDACRKGNLQALKTMYSQNPSVINSKNDSGYSPLMLATYHGKENVVRFLVDKVKNIDDDSKYGTPLMAAAVKGYTTIAKLLIDYNANVNSKDGTGTTALHYATMFKFYEIASYLLEKNADATLKDGRGNTALDYAKLLKNETLINLITK